MTTPVQDDAMAEWFPPDHLGPECLAFTYIVPLATTATCNRPYGHDGLHAARTAASSLVAWPRNV